MDWLFILVGLASLVMIVWPERIPTKRHYRIERNPIRKLRTRVVGVVMLVVSIVMLVVRP